MGAPILINGTAAGVVLGMVNFQKLADEYVAPVRIGEQGIAFVATGVGEIMSHPDKNQVMAPVKPTDLTPKMVAATGRQPVLYLEQYRLDRRVPYRSAHQLDFDRQGAG